ncbi:MAG: exopolysaccharide biosynthesis protein [Rhodospirillales bacterium]|nr:exopolysaccharide biosynthesis protein [Rhodospirillales bacterium]
MDEVIAPPTTDKTSVILRQLLDNLPDKTVTIGFLVLKLRRRSFGGILLLLAALGLLPGISMLAGIAMLFPAVQMVLGFRAPLLPYYVRHRHLSVATVRKFGNRALPGIEKLEVYIKPRWFALTHPLVPRLIGALIVALALLLMLPLPFSNFPPALALLCLSLGFLERDGVLIGVGMILAMAALVIGVTMSLLALEAIRLLLETT